MTAATAHHGQLSPAAVNAKLVSLLTVFAVGFGVFLGGFVFREPAPYELYMAGIIAIWGLFSFRLSRSLAPLLVLLVVFNIGGLISMTQMDTLKTAPMYIAVSLFLAGTAFFYAAITSRNPTVFGTVVNAYIASAVFTSLLGIAGYFGLTGGMFVRYDRAAGGFEDPNVFGPFLVLPAVYLLHRILTGSILRMPILVGLLLVITAGIFLSFSRGAWGLLAFCAIALTGVLLLKNPSPAFRARILIMSLVAAGILAVAVIVALQIPAIADLFETRARLVQDYDGARLGRFARYIIGFELAAERPLGIGPLEFGLTFGEDTHNIWLKALMDYSWLGFAAYLTLIVWTLAAGFRILFREGAWQPVFTCAYIVLVGHVALGTVIDTDHWRHFYLVLGLVWGGIALERATSPRAARPAIAAR